MRVIQSRTFWSPFLMPLAAGLGMLGLLALASGTSPAQAQDTDSVITKQEMRAALDGCSVSRIYQAKLDVRATSQDSARFQGAIRDLLDQNGSDQRYDLTPIPEAASSISFEKAGSRGTYTRRITSSSDRVAVEPFLKNGATHVSISSTTYRARTNKKFVRYFEIRKDGIYDHGHLQNNPIANRQVYEPPHRDPPLPLKRGTSWSTEFEDSRMDREVIDSGLLVTPYETSPVLLTEMQFVKPTETDTVTTLERIFFRRANGTGIAAEIRRQKERPIPDFRFYTRTDLDVEDPPDGARTYCGFVEEQPIAFARPADWIVGSQERRGVGAGLLLIRDTTAAKKLFSGSVSLSTDKNMRLLTDRNVMVGFSTEEYNNPRTSLQRTIDHIPLEDATVVQAPMKMTMAGRPAFDASVQGTDADGRSVRFRKIALTVGDAYLELFILRPTSVSDEVQQSVQTIIESVVLPSQEGT